MFSNHILRLVVILLAGAGVVSGCASTQPESLESAQAIVKVRIPDVQKDERLPLIESNQESTDIDASADAIRWGGTIARVENLAGEKTLIEIVARPLHSNGRPVHNDRSDGRFVAIIDKFLDPEIVVPGRDITVIGTLIARQAGLIGETEYLFPVVAAQGVEYWKKQVLVRPNYFPHWNRYRGHGHDSFRELWFLHRRPGFYRR